MSKAMNNDTRWAIVTRLHRGRYYRPVVLPFPLIGSKGYRNGTAIMRDTEFPQGVDVILASTDAVELLKCHPRSPNPHYFPIRWDAAPHYRIAHTPESPVSEFTAYAI